MARVVVTGGAGFLGSHLCHRLIERGDEVVCLDNLITGSLSNIEDLFGRPGFTYLEHDVSTYIHVPGDVDAVLHFASPASPADFERMLRRMNDAQTYLKLSGPYRIAKDKGYDAVLDIARAIVGTNPDRAIWGSDWPHIPASSRDTGGLVNLLEQWAPDAGLRRKILTDTPARLFDYAA